MEDLLSTANSFDSALSQMGFIYITGHGIPQETVNDNIAYCFWLFKNFQIFLPKVDAVFSESLSFFKLDLEEKMKYERDFASTFHGYTQVGGIV